MFDYGVTFSTREEAKEAKKALEMEAEEET